MKDAEISISQAAPLMGLSRRQTRQVLTMIHADNPEMRVLRRICYGAFKGNHRVSCTALRRIILDDGGILMVQVMKRLGIAEADIRTARGQIDMLKKELERQKNS